MLRQPILSGLTARFDRLCVEASSLHLRTRRLIAWVSLLSAFAALLAIPVFDFSPGALIWTSAAIPIVALLSFIIVFVVLSTNTSNSREDVGTPVAFGLFIAILIIGIVVRNQMQSNLAWYAVLSGILLGNGALFFLVSKRTNDVSLASRFSQDLSPESTQLWSNADSVSLRGFFLMGRSVVRRSPVLILKPSELVITQEWNPEDLKTEGCGDPYSEASFAALGLWGEGVSCSIDHPNTHSFPIETVVEVILSASPFRPLLTIFIARPDGRRARVFTAYRVDYPDAVYHLARKEKESGTLPSKRWLVRKVYCREVGRMFRHFAPSAEVVLQGSDLDNGSSRDSVM